MVLNPVFAALVFSFATALLSSQSPDASIPDLNSLEQLEHEEFEPAIGKQIRHAYEQARRKPNDAEASRALDLVRSMEH